MAGYDMDVFNALKSLEIADEIVTSLSTKLKNHKVPLKIIAGLSNENVTTITQDMIEQVPSQLI